MKREIKYNSLYSFSKKWAILRLVCGMLLLLILGSVIGIYIEQYQQGNKRNSYETIIEENNKTKGYISYKGKEKHGEIRLRYEYFLGGEKFVKSVKTRVNKLSSTLKKGDKVNIYYHSNGSSVIEGIKPKTTPLIMLFLIPIIFPFVILVYFSPVFLPLYLKCKRDKKIYWHGNNNKAIIKKINYISGLPLTNTGESYKIWFEFTFDNKTYTAKDTYLNLDIGKSLRKGNTISIKHIKNKAIII